MSAGTQTFGHRLRRAIGWLAASLSIACGSEAKPEAGPLGPIYLPTGLAVRDHRLLVASSNDDLRYDTETGGSVTVLDVGSDPILLTTLSSKDKTYKAPLAGAVNVRSMAGDLAIADPASCGTVAMGPDPLAVFATRGTNTLNLLRITTEGALSCTVVDSGGKDFNGCGMSLENDSFKYQGDNKVPAVDPFAVGVACGGSGRASVFVGYLRATYPQAWIGEYHLKTKKKRASLVGAGPIRAFAYDESRDRLYMAGLATSSPTPLRWLDLTGCPVDEPVSSKCWAMGQSAIPYLPPGLELRSITLAHQFTADRRRAYLTGRLYDVSAAKTARGRTNDYGGLIIVVDLVENVFGGVDIELVDALPIGRGAQDVRVLPERFGKRDVVAALAVDSGELWIYDDETGSLKMFGRDPKTGAPLLGHVPYGLGVDPELIGTAARVYVGSFKESFVTPIDVPIDAPDGADFSGGDQRKIKGGTR